MTAEKSDSPCLRPLQVVQEVLQVRADPQVPEYRLFQLGLEVLSLPEKQFKINFLSFAECQGSSSLSEIVFLPVRLSLRQVLGVPEDLGVRADLWVQPGQRGRAHRENPTASTHSDVSGQARATQRKNIKGIKVRRQTPNHNIRHI